MAAQPLQCNELSSQQLLDQLDANAQLIIEFITTNSITSSASTPENSRTRSAVTAMIGFEGQRNGMLMLHCPRKSAQRLASSILGYQTSCDDELCGTMGEMVNMLGNDLKEILSDASNPTRLTLPTVLQGDDALCRELMDKTDGQLRSYFREDDQLLIGLTLHDNWRAIFKSMPHLTRF